MQQMHLKLPQKRTIPKAAEVTGDLIRYDSR